MSVIICMVFDGLRGTGCGIFDCGFRISDCGLIVPEWTGTDRGFMGKGQSAWGLARGKGDLSPDYLSSDICSLSSGIGVRGAGCGVLGMTNVD
jgi:hypothetical protein